MREEKLANSFPTKPSFRHFKRKNNDLVAAMYAMYLTGKSLRFIAKIYKRTQQSVYDVFETRGYPLRSKKKYPEFIIDGIKFTPSCKGYWRSTCRKKSLFLHSYIWQKNHGPVPNGFRIHHKDGDKNNNILENLEMLSIQEIGRKYSPHLNQFTAAVSSRLKKYEASRARFFKGE